MRFVLLATVSAVAIIALALLVGTVADLLTAISLSLTAAPVSFGY